MIKSLLNLQYKIKKAQEISFMMRMINSVFYPQSTKILELDFVNNE